jgi:type I restriction-modification system DNA methylase subunit
MYFICNGLKAPEQPFTDPEKFGSLTETYDAGFSFPPFAWRIKNENNGENLILKDMLNNITGRFALIFYLGFTFQAGSSEMLRKQIITEKRLKAIVELPGGFVPYTNVTSVVMFFDKTDDSQDSVMVMSLSDDTCKDKDNSNRYRTVLNDYAVSILNKGLHCEESLFCKKVSFTEIEKNEFCLSPSRYILSAEEQAAKQQIIKGDTKLCDIATFHRVQAIRPENKGNTYYEVNASSINAMGFIDNPEKQICLTNENAASKNTLKKNDIVFAIKGSVGKVGFVAEDHDNWLINQSFVIIRITNPKWPAEYVFRQLKSTAMKLYIQSKTIGSVIPSLTIGELKNLPLVSPTEERVKEQLTKHKRQLEIIQNIDKLKKELNNLNNF